MQAHNPQFNKSELLAELTNKHTAETSAKLDTLKQVGIETVTQLEKLNKNLSLKSISMIKGKDGDKGEKGEKGDDGKKGDKGEQGIKGKDGVDGKDGKDGKQGIQGIAGKDGKDGKQGLSGNDGSPDTAEDIKLKLETLKEDARLDASAIKNLPKGRGGGGGISLLAVEQNFSKILDASGFGRALTKTDDTNVTLTLGGSPTNALLRDTTLTLGWTGQLAVSRGGTAVSTFGGTNTILYTTAADTLSSIATANSGVLVTSGAGVPSIATDIPTAVTIGTAYIYRVGGTDVALADGGTNASLVASNGGIFYSTATAGAILAGTATAGLALVSGASTTPSWFAPTAGSILFAGVGGILEQDNANFFWDDTNNRLGIGKTTPGDVAPCKLELYGTSGNVAGPHFTATATVDTYPLLQILNWTHDNVSINFDSYFDGAWKSSDVGSNFQIIKNSDLLQFRYDSAIAAGSSLTWNAGIAMDVSGNVGIAITNPQNKLDVLGTVTTDQINLRSARAAIVSTDILGGISFTSDDTTLTAPGTVVAQFRAVASATHTATVLDTDFVWRTTKNTTIAEVMRLYGNGRLDIKVQALTGAETLLKINLSDDSGSFLSLTNGTNSDSLFIPWLAGTQSAAYTALIVGGIATTDTGTNAVMRFDVRLASGAVVAVRPLFVWFNFGTEVARIDANVNFGLGTTSFGTNATNVFGIKSGTAPTTGPADTVQFYSSDDAVGHTIPSFYCEGTNVIATGQADSASSVRVKMRINGTVVTLLAI